MNLTNILKNSHQNQPISVRLINAPKANLKKPSIEPLKDFNKASDYEQLEVQKWLMFCSIATTMLDTGTKAMANLKFLSKRNAIYDLIASFKTLRTAFEHKQDFKQKEMDIDNFIYLFLTGSEEHQNRVIKFQESILKK